MSLEFIVVLICGIGTFLLRYLPIWRIRHRAHPNHPSRPNDQRTQRFFAGIGPAALTALLLVSLWPFLDDVSDTPRMVSVLTALLVVYVNKHLTHSLAGSTLMGSAVYGVLMHWLSTA